MEELKREIAAVELSLGSFSHRKDKEEERTAFFLAHPELNYLMAPHVQNQEQQQRQMLLLPLKSSLKDLLLHQQQQQRQQARQQQQLQEIQELTTEIEELERKLASAKICLRSFSHHKNNDEARRQSLEQQFDEYPDLRVYLTYSEVRLKIVKKFLKLEKDRLIGQLKRKQKHLQAEQKWQQQQKRHQSNVLDLIQKQKQLLQEDYHHRQQPLQLPQKQQQQQRQQRGVETPSLGNPDTDTVSAASLESPCSSLWGAQFSWWSQCFAGVLASESPSQKSPVGRSSGSTVSSDNSQSSECHLKSE